MFQIQSQHEHQTYNNNTIQNNYNNQQNQFQKVKILPIQNQSKSPKIIRKIRIKSLPNDNPNQNYLGDALIPYLQQSISIIQPAVFQAISIKRKNLQLFVYTSLVQDGKDYLKRLFKTQNINQKHIHNMIQETIYNINDCIIGQILNGQHNVQKIARPTKQDIFGNNRISNMAIKIKQQMLKAKLSDLKADINTSTIDIQKSNKSSMLLNLNSADLYSQDNHKTKKAKQFIRKMQQIQQQQRRQRDNKQQYKRQKKLQEQAQRKQMQQRLKKQKHQYLIKQYQKKRQQKQQQKKQHQAKNQQFKKFLQQFKGKIPIFKQKQKQFFDKFVIPQNNKKLQILKQIRQQRKPLSHQQLLQHQKQYLQIKQDHVYQKNASKALQQKAKKPDKNYYKSKFHSIIQKQEKQKQIQIDQNQIRIKMYEKRMDYASQIKTKFVPKIDVVKKHQMAKKIQQLSWIDKVRANKSANIDSYKKDGKDNLDKLHQYIAQLRAKGKIADKTRTIQSSPQPNSARYKNYLHELRQSGTSSNMRTSRAHSIDYSSLISTGEDAQRFKISLRKRQQTALRRQQYLANLGSRNLDKYMEEKKKLDEDYLESVKAKMAIINKFQ